MLALGGDAAPAPAGVAARRAALERLADVAAGPASMPGEVRDLPSSPGDPRPPLRLYDPAPKDALPSLLFLHGGGWVAGGLETHDALCRTFAAEGRLRVVAVDYRRAPEHPRPAAVEDAVAALDWLAAETDVVGIAGDSAGAHVAAEAALARRERLGLQLLICPILDPAGALPSRAAFEAGHFIDPAVFAEDRRAYFGRTVVSILDADPTGLPSTLIEAAWFDPFRDEALAYGERLARAGVAVRTRVHPGMIHYFYALAGAIPAALPIIAAIARDAGETLRTAG